MPEGMTVLDESKDTDNEAEPDEIDASNKTHHSELDLKTMKVFA